MSCRRRGPHLKRIESAHRCEGRMPGNWGDGHFLATPPAYIKRLHKAIRGKSHVLPGPGEGAFHYPRRLLQSASVLRKRCSKSCWNGYSSLQAAILQGSVIDSSGEGFESGIEEIAAFICLGKQSNHMMKSKSPSAKILPFTPPQASIEGKLEKWFRGVIQSNRDLMTALERLSAQYEKLAIKPLNEADQAVLLAVQITLNEARNAQVF
jgi:hypothetical protein